jgi:hypothetical protein
LMKESSDLKDLIMKKILSWYKMIK